MRTHPGHTVSALSIISFEPGKEPGNYTLTLSDGREIPVKPLGPDIELPPQLVAGGGIMYSRTPTIAILHRNIPEAFLPYACLHECSCSITQTPGAEKHCCDASVLMELESVPADIMQDYLRWRLEFFRGMIAYFEAKSYAVLLEQMHRSAALLEAHLSSGAPDARARTATAVEERLGGSLT